MGKGQMENNVDMCRCSAFLGISSTLMDIFSESTVTNSFQVKNIASRSQELLIQLEYKIKRMTSIQNCAIYI